MKPTLYKFTSYAAATAIIRNCTIKLSRPDAFNDPFDLLLDEALGSDIRPFLGDMLPAFFDLAASEIDHATIRDSDLGRTFIAINKTLRALSPENLAIRREAFLGQPAENIWGNLTFLEDNNREMVNIIKAQFRDHGVFCAAGQKNSLLMWAHYADQHRGVVIELRPNVDQDSALLMAKPVRYSRERPLIYRTPRDMVQWHFLMNEYEVASQINQGLMYTKSKEWSYEEEYRLVIPRFIPEGVNENFLQLHADEPGHIYFGCRVPEAQRAELKRAARQLNPRIGFSRAVLSRREYALEWIADDEGV
jgi:hypothetical protein